MRESDRLDQTECVERLEDLGADIRGVLGYSKGAGPCPVRVQRTAVVHQFGKCMLVLLPDQERGRSAVLPKGRSHYHGE